MPEHGAHYLRLLAWWEFQRMSPLRIEKMWRRRPIALQLRYGANANEDYLLGRTDFSGRRKRGGWNQSGMDIGFHFVGNPGRLKYLEDSLRPERSVGSEIHAD